MILCGNKEFIKELLLNKYIEEKVIQASDKDIREKGKYVLKDDDRTNFEYYADFEMVKRSVHIDLDYIEYKIQKETCGVISDAYSENMDNVLVIEPEIKEYKELFNMEIEIDKIFEWKHNRLLRGIYN